MNDLLEIRRLGQEDRHVMDILTKKIKEEEYGHLDHKEHDKVGPIATDTLYVYSASYDGAYVGWLSASVIHKAHDKYGILYIDELWVSKDFRRKGIAEALVQKAVELGKELKLWKIRLYVGQDNPARFLYEKSGFDLNLALIGEMDLNDY